MRDRERAKVQLNGIEAGLFERMFYMRSCKCRYSKLFEGLINNQLLNCIKTRSANIFPSSLLLALPCIHVSCWFNCDISLGEPRLECTAIGIHYKYPWMLRRAKMVIQKSQWDFLSLLHRPKDLYHINHWIYNLDNVLHRF